MSTPSDNPIVQQMQLLLGAWGFNFYSDVNKARADDLLVRQRAGANLLAAIKSLAALEQQYHIRFIPPSSREHPYPPADKMAALKQIGALRQRISDLETLIRGGSVPTQDKIWWRFRDEHTLLEALLSYDRLLIEQADLVQGVAARLTADDWDADRDNARSSLDKPLAEVKGTLEQRQRLLLAG